MVKYLCEKGADTQVADLGARYVHCDATAFSNDVTDYGWP